MQGWHVPPAVTERLHRLAHADRWALSLDRFALTLDRSAHKAFSTPPAPRDLERYLASLHVEDLALACACAGGHEGAWEHFVREHRPLLYKAADAIDPGGSARELADSLYGELFGLVERDGERRSLFDYFHGRSSLGTWLRAILAQRHVDRVRSTRRLEPLPAEESPRLARAGERHEPGTAEYIQLIGRTMTVALTRLRPTDRLRLSYYYAHDLTLAQIGRALGEHEATVSRNLGRARRELRADVERQLREQEHMNASQIEECFAAVVDDPGAMDVADLLGPGADPLPGETGPRKNSRDRRSKERAEKASA
jgi:RNA polymerase sigma-70 factor (ECF subfamily)